MFTLEPNGGRGAKVDSAEGWTVLGLGDKGDMAVRSGRTNGKSTNVSESGRGRVAARRSSRRCRVSKNPAAALSRSIQSARNFWSSSLSIRGLRTLVVRRARGDAGTSSKLRPALAPLRRLANRLRVRDRRREIDTPRLQGGDEGGELLAVIARPLAPWSAREVRSAALSDERERG